MEEEERLRDEAVQLSGNFLAFRKSNKIAVFNAGTQNLRLLLVALRIHLRRAANGLVSEEYLIENLGEWVGRNFPASTVTLNDFVSENLNKTDRWKQPEVFRHFGNGLAFGRKSAMEEFKENGEKSSGTIKYRVIQPRRKQTHAE